MKIFYIYFFLILIFQYKNKILTFLNFYTF